MSTLAIHRTHLIGIAPQFLVDDLVPDSPRLSAIPHYPPQALLYFQYLSFLMCQSCVRTKDVRHMPDLCELNRNPISPDFTLRCFALRLVDPLRGFLKTSAHHPISYDSRFSYNPRLPVSTEGDPDECPHSAPASIPFCLASFL
jgi:hypothetical protein